METEDSSGAITSGVPAGAILDTWSNDRWTNGVQIEQMEDLQKLFVQTKNRLYEITVVDRWSGETWFGAGSCARLSHSGLLPLPELFQCGTTGRVMPSSFPLSPASRALRS